MKFKLEHIVILILVAVIIFLTKCEGGSTIKEVVKTDTITRIDTAWISQTIVRDVPFKVIKTDTVLKIIQNTPKNGVNVLDTIHEISRAYLSDITDTLIEGNIETVVLGEMISQKLTYTPLFPKYITKTNEITKYIDNTPKVTPYVSLYAGTNAKLGIGGGLLMEKGYGLNYLYSNKVHYLGLSYRIK